MYQVNHIWTPAQLAFLAAHAELTGPELVAAFRRRFRRWSAGLTGKAIVNRRYVILHAEERREYARQYRQAV